MLSYLGLEYEFDEERTGTENFYRFLFGRWPKKDCMEALIAPLRYLIRAAEETADFSQSVVTSDLICQMFRLNDDKTGVYWTHGLCEDMEKVMHTLRELWRTPILFAYDHPGKFFKLMLDHAERLDDETSRELKEVLQKSMAEVITTLCDERTKMLQELAECQKEKEEKLS